MEMDDNKLKRILQEGMEYEADRIMEEVNSDPNVRDAVAPESIHDNLFQQIREHEEALEKEKAATIAEEQELIRLGKIYKKKRSRRKYYILIAAVVCALAVGTVSFGDGEKVFTEIKRILGHEGQTVVNTDDGDGTVIDEISSEEEAYKQIEEKFGFFPIKLLYLPEGIEFEEVEIDENLMSARICYSDVNDRVVLYYITTNYREGSTSTNVEDKLIDEYKKEINGVDVNLREYLVEENQVNKWMIDFSNEDAQYSLMIIGMSKTEVDEIVENLYFL